MVLLTLQKSHTSGIIFKNTSVITSAVSLVHDRWFYPWTPAACTQCLCDDYLPCLPSTLINVMLGVLLLYKLLFFTRNSFSPNSKSVQYLVPQHQQTGLFQLCHCQIPSDLYGFSLYMNSATKSCFFSNLPINFIHPYFSVLILTVLSIFFLGFFTTLSQKNVKKGASESALHPPIPQYSVFRREGLRSHPCHPVLGSPREVGSQW